MITISIAALTKWERQLYQSGRPQLWVLNNKEALIQGSHQFLFHTQLFRAYFSVLCLYVSNCVLPCTQIVGEMAQPLSKNMQFVWHAQSANHKIHLANVFLLIFIGGFVCHQDLSIPSPYFLLFNKHPASSPRHAAQDGDFCVAAFLTAHPNQYWLRLQHRVPISGKWEFSPFFSLHFRNLREAQLFQQPAPLPARYLH